MLCFEQRQPFGIEMYQLSGVGFIVAFGLLFEFFLNAAFYLGQAFHSVLCLFETVVGTGLGFEQSAPCGFKGAVNGDAADLVAACQGGDAFLPLRVGQPNGLAVVRGETGVFVHVHVSVFSWKYCKQRYWFLQLIFCDKHCICTVSSSCFSFSFNRRSTNSYFSNFCAIIKIPIELKFQ